LIFGEEKKLVIIEKERRKWEQISMGFE